jgi:hypothetical protein
MDFWSMTSDMLLFLRMGFLCKNEFVLDNWLVGSEAFCEMARLEAGWRGP